MKNFITGLGGAFIYSVEPLKLAQWYLEKLGLELHLMDEGGYTAFEWRHSHNPAIKGSSVFSIMKANSEMQMEGRPRIMINLRVEDMLGLKAHLATFDIDLEVKDYPGEGMFAHITDPEGNKIELWQDGFSYE